MRFPGIRCDQKVHLLLILTDDTVAQPEIRKPIVIRSLRRYDHFLQWRNLLVLAGLLQIDLRRRIRDGSNQEFATVVIAELFPVDHVNYIGCILRHL